MANDNHEQYDGNNICTYTDLITIGNTLTAAQVDACILAAGEAPADNPKKIYLDTKASQPGPNSFSPFYFIDPALWYSEEELVDAKGTWYSYLHTVYASTQQNALATQLKIDNYRNFVTITEYTETINGTPHKYYGLSITTKYGDNGDPESTWTNSILKPMYVLAEEDARTGIFLDEIMCKQEYNFTNSWGSMCTDLGFIQGRRNLKDNESGGIIPYGIWQSGLAPEAYHIEGGRQYGDSYAHHLQWQNNPSTFYTASVYNKVDDLLFIAAIGGLKFEYDNTLYKPIVENGVVVGYTDDMSVTSEWDQWEDIGDHVIPVTPPAPGPSGDDEDNKDPVSTTGAPFSAGLCHYYALTAGSTLLEHISEALGTWDIENTHKDLYKNLVSCKLIKPPAPIPTTGSAPFTIYGVKPQYEGADISLPVVSGNPEATFGPYTINRKFGDFRDYAPYTRVSIYLPYCGWCDLPSHVVGMSVTVKYFTDIIAATCKAVVFCDNNIIAEAAGVIGLDIPFVADNVGAKMQAVTAGMIAALGGGIQLGAGIGTMVSTKSGSGAKAALSGASQYLSGYSQMAMAFNENTTEISGKNGDGCCLSGATNIIIKIVRPKKGAYTDSPFTPPGYGHNVGFVSQKQVKVSSVSGLIIADNVDTSGISGATEAERAEIKRVLETGLIVNAAPE